MAPAGKSSGQKKPGEDRYLPGLEGRGQRSFSKGPQEPTCSITLPAGGDPPCLVFLEPRGNARNLQEPIFLYLFFLYKWIHSLLAVTTHNFLNILVPVSSQNETKRTKGSCENQMN